MNFDISEIVPGDKRQPYDVRNVIRAVTDGSDFFEIQESWAANIVIGFGTLNGRTAGFVANQPLVLAGVLDVDSSDKAARFIRYCDAFNIPIISLVDVPGFLPGLDQEHSGIIRHGAKMLYAWTEATVPKISCILRKMYGGAIPAMGVHQIGFDQVFAWPSAEMQMVGAEPSVKILYRRELEQAEDPAAYLEQKIEEYQELYLTPYHSASRSVIDAVIHPKDTRKKIISALSILAGKAESPRQFRKHGNIPL